MLDVMPAAQAIVEEVAEVYLKHTAPWFIGLLVHGSAVKGGIIPGCSDIDFQLYLEDVAFSWEGHLPLEVGFAIRRALGQIDPKPFSYIQCYALSRQLRPDFVGPIPGTYRLIAGHLPVPEATAEQLRDAAKRALAGLEAPTFVISGLLGPGSGRLERAVRLLCTQVWPVLYQILTLEESEPIPIWSLPKQEAIRRLPEGTRLSETVRGFYAAVLAYYPAEQSLDAGLAVIEKGAAFLAEAKAWWQATHA